MRIGWRSFFFLALLGLNTSWAQVYWLDDTSSQGEVGIETRVFDRDSNPDTQDWGVSLFSRVEARYENREFRHVFRGMARIDRKDEGRNIIAIEDAYVSARLFSGGRTRLLAGYKIFNWTATEAFHPADQINSRNYDGELENLEKKGELTVELEVPFWNGTLSFYLFPRFEEPKLPSPNSRLGGTGIKLERPVVVRGEDTSRTNPWVWQYGLSTMQTFSFGDVSLHAIRHINRNYPLIGTADYGTQTFTLGVPPFSIDVDVFGPFSERVTPYYFQSTQVGGTLQLLLPVMTKVEWAYRIFDSKAGILDLTQAPEEPIDGYSEDAVRGPKDHGEIAIGFEYPIDHDSGTESMLLLEFNTFVGLNKEERRRYSIFQRDVFLGYRFSFFDIMGKEFLLSTIIDLEDPKERLYSVTYSQRITDSWRMRMGVRIYDAPRPENPLQASGMQLLRRSDSVNFTLTRFF